VKWLIKHLKPLEVRLISILRKRGETMADAQDLIQETFLRTLERGASLEVEKPEAYLVRTAINLSHNARKRAHRDLYSADCVYELDVEDVRALPEDVIAEQECLRRLQRRLDELAPRTREAFYLHRIDGLSHESISEQLGISVSAVKKHIAKASEALIEELLNR
jgi:RNA polymerase sigma-70 factor (ECF subfamily)